VGHQLVRLDRDDGPDGILHPVVRHRRHGDAYGVRGEIPWDWIGSVTIRSGHAINPLGEGHDEDQTRSARLARDLPSFNTTARSYRLMT
jgi:hypothetical protein